MSDTIALLFGAAIVAVYSYDRFNRATYEGGRHLERLVTLLTPDQMRARRVVFNGYLFYVLTLLTIYFFLCAYAEVLPLLGGPDLKVGASELPVAPVENAAEIITGFIPGSSEALWTKALSTPLQPAAETGNHGIGIDPSVSLAVALIIVGLAPTFPMLRRFEDWMRSAAHHLAGIPTRVINTSEVLRHRDLSITVGLDVPVPSDTLLIPRGDWERMAFYGPAAEGQLAAPDEFRRDIEVVFALSAWLLDRKLKLAVVSGRERFYQLEEDLQKRRNALILALDEKSGYRPGADIIRTESQEDAKASDIQRGSWERLADDADELADDLCVLIALYVEHDLIDFEPAQLDAGGGTLVRQQAQANKTLGKFLSPILSEDSKAIHLWSNAVLVWLWTLGVVLTISVLWSIWPGALEIEMQRGVPGNPYWRILTYASTAFNSYCVPLLVALTIHDSALQAHRWRRMHTAHWTARLPQAASLAFASWAVATLFYLGLALWQTAIISEGGFNTNSLLQLFEYNAPLPFRGAVLALILVVLLDTRAESGNTVVSSLNWSLRTAAIMAVTGALTRGLASWSSASYAGRSIDEIDRGLIVYGAIQSAIIGFVVVYCVSEALANHSRAAGRRSSGEDSWEVSGRESAPTE